MAQQSEEDVILNIENIFKRVALDNILRYYKKYGNIIKTRNNSIVIWLQDEVEQPTLQILNNICFDKITHIIVAKNKNVEKKTNTTSLSARIRKKSLSVIEIEAILEKCVIRAARFVLRNTTD